MSYEAIRRVRLLRPLFGLDAGANAAAAERRAPELVPQDIN
jgi:hypothetical protein